ncbi:hypothetical protein RFI_00603 [Reticulomyxa filosa]|uniref:Uncharacterized protein n=1 Tax=Reticulomyxa filosa TaxID=46433 RepID=X6PED2_RETFI|nr:hypothetical protein RFI_00603 [Reticulomyxa filosa]|eukprot:ETO36458.1 hypothetical protein RFI_00603 [Reticulomyxa filosa]
MDVIDEWMYEYFALHDDHSLLQEKNPTRTLKLLEQMNNKYGIALIDDKPVPKSETMEYLTMITKAKSLMMQTDSKNLIHVLPDIVLLLRKIYPSRSLVAKKESTKIADRNLCQLLMMLVQLENATKVRAILSTEYYKKGEAEMEQYKSYCEKYLRPDIVLKYSPIEFGKKVSGTKGIKQGSSDNADVELFAIPEYVLMHLSGKLRPIINQATNKKLPQPNYVLYTTYRKAEILPKTWKNGAQKFLEYCDEKKYEKRINDTLELAIRYYGVTKEKCSIVRVSQNNWDTLMEQYKSEQKKKEEENQSRWRKRTETKIMKNKEELINLIRTIDENCGGALYPVINKDDLTEEEEAWLKVRQAWNPITLYCVVDITDVPDTCLSLNKSNKKKKKKMKYIYIYTYIYMYIHKVCPRRNEADKLILDERCRSFISLRSQLADTAVQAKIKIFESSPKFKLAEKTRRQLEHLFCNIFDSHKPNGYEMELQEVNGSRPEKTKKERKKESVNVKENSNGANDYNYNDSNDDDDLTFIVSAIEHSDEIKKQEQNEKRFALIREILPTLLATANHEKHLLPANNSANIDPSFVAVASPSIEKKIIRKIKKKRKRKKKKKKTKTKRKRKRKKKEKKKPTTEISGSEPITSDMIGSSSSSSLITTNPTEIRVEKVLPTLPLKHKELSSKPLFSQQKIKFQTINKEGKKSPATKQDVLSFAKSVEDVHEHISVKEEKEETEKENKSATQKTKEQNKRVHKATDKNETHAFKQQKRPFSEMQHEDASVVSSFFENASTTLSSKHKSTPAHTLSKSTKKSAIQIALEDSTGKHGTELKWKGNGDVFDLLEGDEASQIEDEGMTGVLSIPVVGEIMPLLEKEKKKKKSRKPRERTPWTQEESDAFVEAYKKHREYRAKNPHYNIWIKMLRDPEYEKVFSGKDNLQLRLKARNLIRAKKLEPLPN